MKKAPSRYWDIPLAIYCRLATWAIGRLLARARNRREAGYEPVAGRLLYVASSALPYHISGYTTRTHEVLRAIHEVGVDLRVMTRPGYPWDCEDARCHPQSDETTIDGIVYRHVRSPSNLRPLPLYAMQAAEVVKDYARCEKVGAIHAATNFLNALPALLAARQLGIPFHYEMRGLWELTRASRFPEYGAGGHYVFGLEFEGLVARNADRVFVISEQLGKFASERWGIPTERFALLPNCITPERFAPNEMGAVEANCIGYAGALASYEGLDTLIDAVDILVRRGRDVRLRIVGDGEARGGLERQAERLGLSSHIQFLGKVSPASARQMLLSCGLVCIPRKPFKVCEIVPPIKMVEAMAMGKPVIVPDLPVFQDELGEEPAGWFFRAGDAVSLADTIALALGDTVALAEMGRRAREYAVSRRNWQIYVQGVAESVGKLERVGN